MHRSRIKYNSESVIGRRGDRNSRTTMAHGRPSVVWMEMKFRSFDDEPPACYENARGILWRLTKIQNSTTRDGEPKSSTRSRANFDAYFTTTLSVTRPRQPAHNWRFCGRNKPSSRQNYLWYQCTRFVTRRVFRETSWCI